MSVSIGREDLEDAIVDCEKGDIEGSTTKIEDEDVGLSPGLVHSVRDGSSGGLIDDTLNLHSRDSSGILGRLTLRIVEIRGNGHDGVLDLLTKEDLGGVLHLLKDHG
mmetsp:Transcript_30288/g.49604  ORF Transcript_30288/g.49604 Transcript_30288/m.49604 type:complete len:107 (+) Transcript_30288:1344-1664(+)